MSNFFRDILKISGSNTLVAIISIGTGIIITRMLGPEGRGVYAALMVVPAIVLRFAELGIRRSVIFHIGKEKFQEKEVVSSLFITFFGTILLGIIISIFFYVYLDNPEFTIPLIILAISRIPLRLIRQYAGGYFMGKQMYNTTILLRWAFQGIYLLNAILFLIVLKLGVLGALLAIIVSNLIVSLYTIFLFLKNTPGSRNYNHVVLKSLLRFGLLYSASTFFMMLHIKIDVLIMGKLTTFNQIGFYSLATAIATNWQIPFSVGGIIISKSANTEDVFQKNENIGKLVRLSFLLGSISYIVLYIASPFVVKILYGEAFLPSVPLIRFLLPGILMLIVSQILASRLAGEGKPYIFMYIAIPALILNIFLNYFWIPRYDAMGAVYATNISYSFMTVAGIIVYSRVVESRVWDLIRYRKSDFDFIPIIKKKIIEKLKRVKGGSK
ncbi:MAG: oligosaccharide flippase family protein [Bacteroidales bacterium]